MRGIRHLVFDLGGVLYAIDPPRTTRLLLALHPHAGAQTPGEWIARAQPDFDALESGHHDPAAFRQALRAHGIQASDAEIDHAWNALLLGPIPGRAEDLALLARTRPLALLSNTNIIHQECLRPACAALFAPFSHLFFSYDMGLRKPDTAIYTQAVAQLGWHPAECLFVDDNTDNVEGAIRAGLQARHVRPHHEGDWKALMAELR